MQIIRKHGYARAGLMGNPSDGYYGKTISLLIRNFKATVILYEWEQIEVLLSQEDHSCFESIGDLARDVRLHGYYGGVRLVKATIKRFHDFCVQRREAGEQGYELHDRTFAIRYESNIPRQVGLAGSSAIIAATLKALMKFYEVEIPKVVQPSLVLSVENEELGIAAGLQDRVIQIYGGLVYMDFSVGAMQQHCGFDCGVYEPLDPQLLPPIYLAYAADVGEPTEVLHRPLKALYDRGDPQIHQAMADFAEYARQAREALLAGEPERFAELINQNFDLRARICSLQPAHVKMIEAARSAGASAKFAGSGGAIVGTYRDEAMFHELDRKLQSLNCRVLCPQVQK